LDGIPGVLTKDLSEMLAYIMKSTFNRSLSTQTFPAAWKEAVVVPVSKKNERSFFNNYAEILTAFPSIFKSVKHQQN
jgi:hypothetical protein